MATAGSARPREWWEVFFAGAWLDFQRAMDTPERVKPMADFVQNALRLPAGARLLDVPCGEGRLTRELARRGFRMAGLDRTEALLRVARRKAAGEDLAIDWRQGDMRKLPWRERFDAVLCLWGSFGYFDEAGNQAQARAACRALKPGGVFFMDTHSPETLFPRFRPRNWMELGGIRVLSTNRYDLAEGRIETDWMLMKGNRCRRARSSLRLYTGVELIALFDGAGFNSYEFYGGLEAEPFDLDSSRLLFVARKK
jgi:SAM-dependent methyltransferase